MRPIVAAKLELYSAMRRHRITKTAFAKHLGISDSVAGRIGDPDHRSRISQVQKALRAVASASRAEPFPCGTRTGSSPNSIGAWRDRV